MSTLFAVRDCPLFLRVALFFALTLHAGIAVSAPAADPLVGKWWGTVTGAHETVDYGMEFRSDENGEIHLAITQPGANYFGMEYPGVVHREGKQVTLTELNLKATLSGDRLKGTVGRSSVPIDVRRVETLPQPEPVPALPTGSGPRWQTRLSGQIYASPVVADGIAYVGTTGGVFNAVNTTDGSLVWTFSAGRPIFGAARVTEDAVYFACDNGYLFKLERASGKELWRYDLGDERVSRIMPHPQVYDWDWHGPRPLVADGVVYVGSGDGSLHAADATTGARRWRAETGGRIRGGAALDGDRVVVGSADKFVYAFDRATGREIWKHDSEAEIEDEPLVADGKVYIGNRGVGMIALDAAKGERLWQTSFWGSWLESTPVIVDGVLYVGSSDLGNVSAINPADGRVLWRSDVHGWTFGTPLVTSDRIYAGTAGGTPYFISHVAGFCVLDRATGKLLQRWPLAESAGHQWGIASSLALAGDTVVAATVDGSIYGFAAR